MAFSLWCLVPPLSRQAPMVKDPSGIRLGAECGIWNTEYGIQNTEYGVRSTEYRIQNTEYGIGNTEYGIRNTEYGIQNTEYGQRRRPRYIYIYIFICIYIYNHRTTYSGSCPKIQNGFFSMCKSKTMFLSLFEVLGSCEYVGNIGNSYSFAYAEYSVKP